METPLHKVQIGPGTWGDRSTQKVVGQFAWTLSHTITLFVTQKSEDNYPCVFPDSTAPLCLALLRIDYVWWFILMSVLPTNARYPLNFVITHSSMVVAQLVTEAFVTSPVTIQILSDAGFGCHAKSTVFESSFICFFFIYNHTKREMERLDR